MSRDQSVQCLCILVVPSNPGRQARAVAIAYNVLGVSNAPMIANSRKGTPHLILGFLFDTLWLLDDQNLLCRVTSLKLFYVNIYLGSLKCLYLAFSNILRVVYPAHNPFFCPTAIPFPHLYFLSQYSSFSSPCHQCSTLSLPSDLSSYSTPMVPF